MIYQKYGKRFLDVLFASLMLLVALLPMLLIVILIFATDPGAIFFSQNRIGAGKKQFQMYKFRTMRMDTPHDVPTHELEDPEQYITKIGKILRKTSLDELPQLINILRGDMSLVGPRPALWNQYDLLEERDKYGANAIRPGLFGWAQMNGRDRLTISRKAELDGEYVKRISFLFDCRCLIGSILSSILQKDIVEGKQKRK